MRWIVGYLATMAVFIAGDLGWLTLMGPRVYRPVIGPLLADKPDLRPAIAFYLLYGIGILVFAIAPALKAGRPLAALGWGALAGLFAYGAYDLTNRATLRLWSTRLSLIDIAWGACITGLAALVGCLTVRMLSKG
jgi:uncharacterized membrane protein